MTKSKRIIVNLSYARSGGTMLSSILGSHSDLCTFSEVNPKLNAVSSIKEQAFNWYGISISSEKYLDSLVELSNKAELVDKTLFVRDFTLIDFTPHLLNEYKPLNDFGGIRQLESKFEVKKFAFVRNAFDVWISRDCPPRFGEYYLNYVKKIIGEEIQIFKYEEFCQKPEKEIHNMCQFLEISTEADILKAVSSSKNTTGDITVKKSRGRNDLGEIKVLSRKQIPKFLMRKAMKDPHLKMANSLLGYSGNILNEKFEYNATLKVEMKWIVKRLLGRYPSARY